MYLSGPVLSSRGFLIAIVFEYMFGLPCKNLEQFQIIWQPKLRKKEERKVILSLKSCGFQVGPYGMVTRKLGLIIRDDIISNTVSALLLDVSENRKRFFI